MKLEGKVAIVTGAAQGLGRAFCLRLAAEGAAVVAVDRNLAGAEATAEEITKRGGQAIVVQADVSREADTLAMAKAAVEKFGRLDILVNNAAFYAGISRKPFYEIDPDEWDRVMLVNAKGPWLCARAVFPYMRAQGKGKIINLASEVFFTGSHNLSHYVASKGAVVGLTRALAREMGPYNICVNAIAPGFTDTEGSRTITSDITKYDVSPNCIKRLGQPEDLVGLLVFLASDDSDFLTGQTILVDGGRVMH